MIVGLFRGAQVIVAADNDFQAETVRRIGEARGGKPDLHILDMNDPDWTTRVLDLTDGVGPAKIADFTSEEEVQRMWDVVATHEFPMTEAEQALKISASQRCGKILLYPHGLPSAQGGD